MTKGYKIMAVILLVLTTVAFALSIVALTTCINNQKTNIHDEAEEEPDTYMMAIVWTEEVGTLVIPVVDSYERKGDMIEIINGGGYSMMVPKDHCLFLTEVITMFNTCPECIKTDRLNCHGIEELGYMSWGKGKLYHLHCWNCDLNYYYYVED